MVQTGHVIQTEILLFIELEFNVLVFIYVHIGLFLCM